MARDFGRWFRMYDAALDDPKVQRLNDRLFRGWVNLLCLANRAGGKLPSDYRDIAFALRCQEGQARETLQALISAGLIDTLETGYEPHNWPERQFKSDVSTERVKRFRKRFMKQDETFHETPPDTEADTEQNRGERDARAAREELSPNTSLSKPLARVPKREPWPQSGVVPETWFKMASDGRAQAGLAAIDLKPVAVKFANYWAVKSGGEARTMTEWQAKWISYAIDERMLNGNGSGARITAHPLGVFGKIADDLRTKAEREPSA